VVNYLARVFQLGLKRTNVSSQDADCCRADDRAIHDTVLIAAAFCMYNRYVDGLAIWASQDVAD